MFLFKSIFRWAWWHMPIIPGFRKQRKNDLNVEIILGKRVSLRAA